MTRSILLWPNGALAEKCTPALTTTLARLGLMRLCRDLHDTMVAAGGVGLAASQVGVFKRVVVVRSGMLSWCLVNPVLELTGGAALMDEGCLSLPGWFTPVLRAAHVVARAELAWVGRPGRLEDVAADFELRSDAVSGVEATRRLGQVLQHEVDHLDGVTKVTSEEAARGAAFKQALRAVKTRYPMGTWLPTGGVVR